MYKHAGHRLRACSGYICDPQSGQGRSSAIAQSSLDTRLRAGDREASPRAPPPTGVDNGAPNQHVPGTHVAAIGRSAAQRGRAVPRGLRAARLLLSRAGSSRPFAMDGLSYRDNYCDNRSRICRRDEMVRCRGRSAGVGNGQCVCARRNCDSSEGRSAIASTRQSMHQIAMVTMDYRWIANSRYSTGGMLLPLAELIRIATFATAAGRWLPTRYGRKRAAARRSDSAPSSRRASGRLIPTLARSWSSLRVSRVSLMQLHSAVISSQVSRTTTFICG